MKIKTLTKTGFLAAVLIGSPVTGHAEESVSEQAFDDLYGSPFDTCFENGYNNREVTKEHAFETAECFSTLLESSEDMGADMQTILQYTSSWYQTAAEMGHEQALVRMESSLLALSFLDYGIEMSRKKLEAERVFDSYDANKDGMLTLAEVDASEKLKASFKASDLDQDGVLSVGEFTIINGEATAAGY